MAHGLLNQIEMKTDRFKEDYGRQLNLSDDEIKIKSNRAHVYYFNVDLKFILKARLHLVS